MADTPRIPTGVGGVHRPGSPGLDRRPAFCSPASTGPLNMVVFFVNMTGMNLTFTQAARRALRKAARWSSRAESVDIEAPALLLALLDEAECRAAAILQRHRIDTASVRRRWSDLGPMEPGGGGQAPASVHEESPPEAWGPRFVPELADSLAVAADHLADLPQPFDFATEHLLLALAVGKNPVGDWLAERGLRAGLLKTELLAVYGLSTEPLPLDADLVGERPEAAPEAASPGVSEQPARGGDSGRPTLVSQTPHNLQSTDAGHIAHTSQHPLLPRTSSVPLLRLIDAATNRAREGLRTIEDYVRFVLDDGHLTNQLKALRHDLVEALSAVPLEHRLAARDTRGDVGTGIETASERERPDTSAVVTAGFTRLEEALRSLEEYGKIAYPEISARIERLRYRAYTLQKALAATCAGLDRLGGARLCVLVDGRASVGQFEKLVGTLVAAGVDMIQLRDKTLSDRELLDRARRLRRLTRGAGGQPTGGTLFLLNDRADVAALAQADGVHLGQQDLTVKEARRIVGPQSLVGVSTHSIEEAREAVLEGADYLGAGPTFASGTKSFATLAGLGYLRQVAAEIRLPVFAIGGIAPDNVAQVWETGVGRVAVSGAVVGAHDPAAVVRALLAPRGD